jgi:hypothetical protein
MSLPSSLVGLRTRLVPLFFVAVLPAFATTLITTLTASHDAEPERTGVGFVARARACGGTAGHLSRH